MRNQFKRALAALAVAVTLTPSAHAQQELPSIGIMAGEYGSAFAQLGEELGQALNGWSGTEVRTMLGKSSRQTIDDLLYLRGVDLGFVNADQMINLQFTDPNHAALSRLAYVAKVFDSELHLVVRKDGGINSAQDLNGKRISVGTTTSDSALTSRLVMRMLGVRANAVFLSTVESIDTLKRGEIDAMFYVGPAPSPILAQILQDDGLKLANIGYSDAFAGIYEPTEITAEVYPDLLEDKFVETISVPTILAVYNKFPPSSARYKNLVLFTDAFLATVPRLGQPPRHPKWQDIDLTATVDGWTQFEYFRTAIDRLQ